MSQSARKRANKEGREHENARAKVSGSLHIQALQERIRFLENAQGTSVQALINRITHYGSRRLEDFDKYEALHLAEELIAHFSPLANRAQAVNETPPLLGGVAPPCLTSQVM